MTGIPWIDNNVAMRGFDRRYPGSWEQSNARQPLGRVS